MKRAAKTRRSGPPAADGPPTVAVVPFSATEGAAWLAAGLHEDICGELTRFRGLRVVAPASAAAVADRADLEIATAVRATHVLRGRIRGSGESFEISVALSDAQTAVQIYTDRISLEDADVARVERAVVARVAATLHARLEKATHASALRRPAHSLAAYELAVRGLELLRDGTLEADEAARRYFEQALAIDPLYPRAHAGIALSWFNEWSCQFWDRFEEASRRAYAHAHRALELDDSDAMVHLVVAKMALFRREWEQAAWYLDRALFLCPNDADLLAQASVLEVALGRPADAVTHLEEAMALNPYHPAAYHVFACLAHVFAGRFDDAAACRARSDAIPFVDAPVYAAVAFAHLGRLEEARAEYQRYLEVYRQKIVFGADHAPDAPRRWIFENNPFRREEDVAMLREGLGRIGIVGDEKAPVRSERAQTTETIKRSETTDPAEGASAKNVFAPQGDTWLLAFAGERAILPDLKGLHDLRRLLEQPGDEVHCLDLADRDASGGSAAVLDAKARAALKERLRDLEDDIDDAEAASDLGRAEHARGERTRLVESLSAALGIGGRSRRLGDEAERARTTIAWRIRHALRRIEAAHPALGRHLANSVRTGTFCVYRPEAETLWSFDGRPPSAPPS